VAARQHRLDRDEQAVAEVGMPGFDQADRGREVRLEERRGAGRPVRHVAGDRCLLPGRRDIGSDILEECGVERGRLVEAERRHEAGLGLSGDRSLRHHGDAAGCNARSLIVPRNVHAGSTPRLAVEF
jgi:hypothetical protein